MTPVVEVGPKSVPEEEESASMAWGVQISF